MCVMGKNTGQARQARLFGHLLGGAALAVLLAGCETASQSPSHTGSIGNSAIVSPSDLSPEQAVVAVQKWGAAYTRNEKDRVAALNYAAALRAAGQTGQAVAVMRKSAIYNPEDREVLAAYGKALAANGQFEEALATVQRAQRTDNPDWQLLSTEGGIRDSIGQHEQARTLYRQALVLAPGEPQILNNFGLSYVLTNELVEAEKVLSEAAASPKATRKIRENLALVLRLQGKAAEADQIVGMPGTAVPPPLPSTQGAAQEQNAWKDLAQNG
jgi:Flp pilus assembly protein TadD